MKKGNYKPLTLTLLTLAATMTRSPAQSIYTPYAFTNFAGLPGVSGTNDGTGSAARFGGPGSVTVDGTGNLYATDFDNNTIRKVTPAGVVTTLAGLPGTAGTNDGIGSAARFDGPSALGMDAGGNLYLADYRNHTIRKVTPVGVNWVVTTLAGLPGTAGTNDGTGSAARFNLPIGMAVDSSTNLYVGDSGNNTIRKITPAGEVTTLAGSAGQSGSADGIGSAARFNTPHSVGADSAGNIYVADSFNHTIRKVTPAGAVTTLAGSAGQPGSADGTGSAARFNSPYGMAVTTNGTVYVTEKLNNTIRRITPAGAVTTLAGLAGHSGSLDGIGSAARFNAPYNVAISGEGNLYVTDNQNYRITKGTPLLQFDTAVGLTVSNALFQVRLLGPFGSNAVVEVSTDLQSWTPVQTNAISSSGFDLSVPQGPNQNQFFRARLAP